MDCANHVRRSLGHQQFGGASLPSLKSEQNQLAVQTILVAPRVLVSHGSSSGIKTVFQPLLPELTLFCLVLAQPQASLRCCAHLAIATPCQSSTPLLLSIAVSARSRHRAGHKAVPRVPAIYRNNNW